MPDIPRFTEFSRIVIFTGAGMSAESGVPTYRGQGGVWKQYDYRRYACQQAFDSDPAAVMEFHDYRRKLVDQCPPNAGHQLVAELQARKAHTRIITQNIDGLHQAAGATDVVELHGSLWRLRCDGCGARREGRDIPIVPRHCACGRYWRPDIVWFGDMLDEANLESAISAMDGCDLLVSIGTSAVVYPAAQLPTLARDSGATLVEINPEETELSAMYHHCLRGPASQMLPKMLPKLL